MGAIQEFDYEKISLLFRRIGEGQDSNLWVNPETLGLPKRFEDEVKKYLSLNETLIQSPLIQLDSNPLTPEPFDDQNSDNGILTPDPQIISVARRAELKAENQTLKAQLTMKNEENKTLARQVEDMHSKKFLKRKFRRVKR